MNTADVRDMNHNQWIFRAMGILVTIFVLTLACVYGYRGDEIRDWVIQQSHRPNNKIRDQALAEGTTKEDIPLTCVSGTAKKPRKVTDCSTPHLAVRPKPIEELDSQSNDGGDGGDGGKPSIVRKESVDSPTLLQQSSRNGEMYMR